MKSTAQTALSRGSSAWFPAVVANFADRYPCPASSDKINLRFANGLCAAQPPSEQLFPQLSVVPVKHREASVNRTESQDPAPSMPNHAGRPENQVLYDRLDAPAPACVTRRLFNSSVGAAAKKQLVGLRNQLEPRCCMRVNSLGQGRARGSSAQAQRTFTQAQQGRMAFEDLRVGNLGAHRKLPNYGRIDLEALAIFANARQLGMGAEIVVQFPDNEMGHAGAYSLGQQFKRGKSCISNGKSTYSDLQGTDPGLVYAF